VAGSLQARRRPRADGARPRRELAGARRSDPDDDAPLWPAGTVRAAQGADAGQERHHARDAAPLHRGTRVARRCEATPARADAGALHRSCGSTGKTRLAKTPGRSRIGTFFLLRIRARTRAGVQNAPTLAFQATQT